MNVRIFRLCCAAVLLLGMASCSVYKYVPEGSYLLDKVQVMQYGSNEADTMGLDRYAYQKPNTKWLGVARIPLRIYSLSSSRHPDRLLSRMLRNLGEEPVIYSGPTTESSASDMRLAMMNLGYLNAKVDTSAQIKGRKISSAYHVNPGRLFVVDTVRIDIDDDRFKRLVTDNMSESMLHAGMSLNPSVLDAERSRIVALAHKNGYYAFDKEHISFIADTAFNSSSVGLRMTVAGDGTKRKYNISQIRYNLSPDAAGLALNLENGNSTGAGDFTLYYPRNDRKPILKPGVISGHSFLKNGQMYNSDIVKSTYESLSRLSIVQYSNIGFEKETGTDSSLVATVSLVSLPKHSIGFEIEGTNTAGDLGAAASMSYTDRNMFRGSEQLTLKLRGAYESISNLPGYSGDTYLEYGAEANLVFPEFLVPFMNEERQRKSQATSQFSLKVNAQKRPEFQKTIFSAGWSYVWGDTWRKSHKLDVLDLNYLVVPWISGHFQSEYLDQITSSKSILKYNYENLLITKLGYTFYHTNAKSAGTSQRFQYTVRAGVETSGNMMYMCRDLLDLKKNSDCQAEVLGIAFAQYAKHDFSFTANWKTGDNSNFLTHVEWGVAVPYGNSTSLPFEKRYFAGGANGVRGWAVRALGPGTFGGQDRTIDYIRQSGDIKLGASIEYRAKLLWKINGAAFVDAGNIWTIREYEEQPGGVFNFDEFYRQIAVAYGLGVRLDLSFLVVRLDGGMKAYNPAGATEYDRLPLTHPSFDRDFAFHLAVGYPF